MGLGSIYAGIGLAQGLGGIPEAYAQGQQAAQQLAMQKMQQENLGLTRERTLAQMKDEQQLRETLLELGGLGSQLQSAFTPITKEVATTVNAPIIPETAEGEGTPFVQPEGMAYKLLPTTKKVQSIDYDKVADLKNRMAMGYQQAALLDPRYAALGEKAIQGIDERILKRTFAAGVTGDVDTISSGLKALTGQEFEITKEGDLFSIKGVGDSAPMKVRLDELISFTEPANFVKYAQRYAEIQQKAKTAEQRLIYSRDELKRLRLFPFVVPQENGSYIGFPDKSSAEAYAQKMGEIASSNPEFSLVQADIALKRSQAEKNKKGSESDLTFVPTKR